MSTEAKMENIRVEHINKMGEQGPIEASNVFYILNNRPAYARIPWHVSVTEARMFLINRRNGYAKDIRK